MLAGLILTIFFVTLLLKNYRRGVICVGVTLQFLSYLGTGIPGVKIFVAIALVILSLYVFHIGSLSKDPYPKPLKYASYLFVCSFLVTLISTNFYHYQTILANIITYFIFPFILWKCITDRSDLIFAIKIFSGFMVVALLVSVGELVSGHNYCTDLIQSLFVCEDFVIDKSSARFGLKRCNSIFSYFSAYGIACFGSIIIFFIYRFYFNYGGNKIAVLTIACFFGAFSTGSRALYLGLFAIVFSLFFHKKFLSSGFAGKLKAFIIIFSPIILEVLYMVLDSMINSDHSEYASGSSSEMRKIQWEVCFPYFMDSPWVGNGRLYIWDVVKKENYILLGAESIWFSIFVDYGILGAVAFLNLIYSCSKSLFSYNKRLLCLPIGYLLILSLSPDVGQQYNILLSFTIIVIKMYRILGVKAISSFVNV